MKALVYLVFCCDLVLSQLFETGCYVCLSLLRFLFQCRDRSCCVGRGDGLSLSICFLERRTPYPTLAPAWLWFFTNQSGVASAFWSVSAAAGEQQSAALASIFPWS